MVEKIGNLSFVVKSDLVLIKQYCLFQKEIVLDFGTFQISSLGIWCDDKSVVVCDSHSRNVNYNFNTDSEKTAKKFVTQLSKSLEETLFLSKKENDSSSLRISE